MCLKPESRSSALSAASRGEILPRPDTARSQVQKLTFEIRCTTVQPIFLIAKATSAARSEFVFHRSTVQEIGAPAMGGGVVQSTSLHLGDSQVDSNFNS